jgi:CheY-like chemotaxis protein
MPRVASRPILIVAPQLEILLGLSQALLKFGYQIMTAYPEPDDLERGARMRPSLVILRPPAGSEERARCLGLIRSDFLKRGVAVLALVTSDEEGEAVQKEARNIQVLLGKPLRLNELYLRLQNIFENARRRELRIRTELAVAHREPGIYREDFYNYDTITSLSMGGCYIKADAPHPVGTRIEIVFCVGSGTQSIRTFGVVRRHGQGDSGEPSGMGVEFEPLTDANREALETFLMSQLGTADMPSAL